MPTLGTSQLAGGRRMIRPKGFLHCWLKYLMTFRTDIFYVFEIIPTDYCSPQCSHNHPNDKRPPYASDNPEYNRKPLQCCDGNPRKKHRPTHFFNFFLPCIIMAMSLIDSREKDLPFSPLFISRSFASFSCFSDISSVSTLS